MYPEKIRSDYYLQPFNFCIWIVILFLVIIGVILCLVIHKMAENQKERTWIDSAFLSIETFAGQCGNDNIQNPSLRTVCIVLRITVLMLVGFYGAVITSFFAIKLLEVPFKSKEEFLQNGQYRLGIRKDDPILKYYMEVITLRNATIKRS